MKHWIEAQTNDELKSIINIYNEFHDGCIKEIKYISGSYVDEDLSMMPMDSIKELSVIIQRQNRNPSVIELVFSGVERLNLVPSADNYDSIIFSAILEKQNGSIYFADCRYEIEQLESMSNHCTWIKAKNLKWRVADEYIGSELVYTRRNGALND